MRSDVDFSTPPDQGFRRSRPWFWRWMLGGIVAVIALAIAEAPVWAFALVLMAWCAAGLMWLRSDALAAARQMNAERANSEALVLPPPPETPNWHNWISGWYWETNAQHQLQVFKPGTNLPPQVSVDWAHLSEYVESGPAWLSNWSRVGSKVGSEDGAADSAADSAARSALESDLGRLSYCLAQKVASGETLNLPWPDKLQGLSVAACEGWRCLVQCEPRWDGQGQFLGFRGVLQMVAPVKREAQVEAEAALSKAAAEAAVQNAQMSEAEQEVLRYALSHDLRAPLRVVEGFTRIVKEDYGRAMDRLGNDHLDRVLTAAARMNGMIDAILAQAELAAERAASMDGIWAELYARDDKREPADVDEDLYGGFVGNEDRRVLQRLRGLSPQQLAERTPGFADERLEELLFRYRARNFPDTLSEAEQARWHELRVARLHEGQGGGLSLSAFFERIDALSETLREDDERGQDILGALYDYAEQIAP